MQKLQLVTSSEHLFGSSALAIAGRVLIGCRMAERHDCKEDAFWSVSTYAMQAGSIIDVSCHWHHHLHGAYPLLQ